MTGRPCFVTGNAAALLGIAFCTEWLACCITLLSLAGRAVMELGGFVASGGPYQIVQPAPEWVVLVPISILSGFAFGGLSIFLSNRLGGFSLIPIAWSGIFLSLGYQFACIGLNPPQSEKIAIGWVICAIFFIPMGLTPIPMIVKGRGMFGLGDRAFWNRTGEKPCDDPRCKAAYLACVAAGAAGGITAGILIFRAIAG